MKIFISPAKKMKEEVDFYTYNNLPCFLEKTKILADLLKSKTMDELLELFKCSKAIAELNYERYKNMELLKNQVPAIMSYEGIQYQYMAPQVFEESYFEYIENNLRILSGFYGILKPFDGVVPYRLEMQTKLKVKGFNNLYDFWGKTIYDELTKDDDVLINLASKEYSKVITPYLTPDKKMVECIFAEEINGKTVEKGVYVKMARGEMVRFSAENNIENIEDLKNFDRLGYSFRRDLSDDKKFVFIKG